MKGKKSTNIIEYFKTIEDPRMERNKLHNLWDILVITICTVVCGMVSAWAHENRVVLGQVNSDDHSNEGTAIPRLLEVLELKGCIVTIDAIGCQHEIATAI